MRRITALVALARGTPSRSRRRRRSQPRGRRTTTRASSCSPSTTFTATSSRPRRDDPGRLLRSERDRHRVDAAHRPAGGVEYFATHLKGLRTANTNTITVGAGDLIGASPLISGLFHDEPAIHSLQRARARRLRRRQPRVRRGPAGALPDAVRRLHAARPLRRSSRSRRDLPVPRRERRTRGDGRDDPPGLRDQEDRQREGRVHRPDARGDADDRHAVRRRRPRVPAAR